MKRELKSNKYVNIVIILCAAAAVFLLTNDRQPLKKSVTVKKIANPILPKTAPAASAIYEIDKIKKDGHEAPGGDVADLQSLYKNYPKERAGDNMIEIWAKANPKDKARFMTGVDQAITKSQEALKVNPADKAAKSKLAISEMMKKLAMNNFNYEFKKGAVSKK